MAGILQSSIGLLKSRLSRRIVSWVFFSIIVIEGVIFVPSYFRRQREKLADLEEVSSEVLFSLKTSAMQGASGQEMLDWIENRLKPDSVIRGGALYTANGTLIGEFGEVPYLTAEDVTHDDVKRWLGVNQTRYDVAWPSDRFADQYILIIRHDATSVRDGMRQYALAIGGLVIIISGFVTFVTILVLERILIIPILRLRDDLLIAGEAVGKDHDPNFYTKSLQRRDELGEVANAFLQMFNRIRWEIQERKQVEVALRAEQEKSERLLLNVLPAMIAEKLKVEQGAIASRFEEATILFADIVDFTGLSAHVPPTQLVCLLNDIFSAFDGIAERYGLEKIKTIGDAYMAVGGLPTPRPDHAEAVMAMALDMLQVIQQFQYEGSHSFHLRIGINSGPVVAGVIGIKKFSYDLWGDAVNIASRMESHGVVDRIQVSEATYLKLQGRYQFEDRGLIAIKGRGEMHTYLVIPPNVSGTSWSPESAKHLTVSSPSSAVTP